MRCIAPNKMYWYRGQMLLRYDDELNKGIGTDEDDCLFRTFADAKRYVDKRTDGTHDREPVVIGHWRMKEQ